MNDVMHDVMMPCMAAGLRGTKSFELFGGTHEDCRNRFGQESFVLSLRAPCSFEGALLPSFSELRRRRGRLE